MISNEPKLTGQACSLISGTSPNAITIMHNLAIFHPIQDRENLLGICALSSLGNE